MKGISIVTLLCWSMAAQAQSFTVQGKIDGLQDAVIYLYHDKTHDSTALRNGAFTFKGSVPHPQEAFLFTKDHGFSIMLYLENTAMTVKGRADAPEKVAIAGGAAQREYAQFLQTVKPVTDRMDPLYALLQKDRSKKDSVLEITGRMIEEEYNPLCEQFIQQHPASYVSLYKLKDLLRSKPLADMEQAFARLAPQVRASAAGKLLQEEFDIMHKTEPGQPAMDFTMNTPAGKPLRLASFKGSYVLLDFWASWCKPCREENPALKKAYDRFKDRNFRILGVSLDRDSTAWVKAIATDGLPWEHVSDLGLWDNNAAKRYNIKSIPSNFLIGPDGVIIAKDLNGQQLEEKLSKLLQ
ncbi:AhpC/TSA family protein [Chitinophaga lutea]|uniref:AhpC/TSA family protein n=1 Tax=Chitinophaga lutea TaxID=2488634 RepID=A0A3N4PAZ3_9BACT|nr:TlpA disulfide reductase family protein [Chitinophaga lutea]RPE05416.1 AhpC/TSA family protein [Chitinophaga lutea]